MNIKKTLTLLVILFCNNQIFSQKFFFTETFAFAEFKNEDTYSYLGQVSWYRSECLYNKDAICINSSQGGMRVKLGTLGNAVTEKILLSNGAGYKRPAFDTLTYTINIKSGKSYLVRQLFFEDKYKADSSFAVDTLNLKLVDNIKFSNKRLIKRIFVNKDIDSLNIYVFSSSPSQTNADLHFWAENIGIIKVVYKDCWKYSFEIDLHGRIKDKQVKFFSELLSAVKEKYPDPLWYDAPCDIGWE